MSASPSAPFANCRFRICDLPGQCTNEGKCHHPSVPQPPSASPSAVAQEPGTITKSVPIDPTPAMIEAGAQRLVRCETGEEVWPDGWDALQVSAARNEAERAWRSMWLASAPTLTVALSLYESAVKGRWEMRQALRKCREENKALIPASELAKAQQERDALKAEIAGLRAVMRGAVELAVEAHAHWDADRDVKVGKIVMALAYPDVRGYDHRADALHAALAKPPAA